MKHLLNVIIVSLFFLISCSNNNGDTVISKSFINEEWYRFEYLNGEVEIDKDSEEYDITMEIKVSDIYPNVYANHQDDSYLPFNMTIKHPDGSVFRSMNYKYDLKDKDGNWKADKNEGYYTFILPVISGMSFGDAGTYTIKIENKYPKDPLYGIKDITIKCKHSK